MPYVADYKTIATRAIEKGIVKDKDIGTLTKELENNKEYALEIVQKTDFAGIPNDRKRIDEAVEKVIQKNVEDVKTNNHVAKFYFQVLSTVGLRLLHYEVQGLPNSKPIEKATNVIEELADVIYDVAKKYNYQGAFLGELNYASTRLIQRFPQVKVERGEFTSEFRYWLYAKTVKILSLLVTYFNGTELDGDIGIGGVFEDVKDELKRRVNPPYEGKQIRTSGDCIFAPFHTVLSEVVDENGKQLGHIWVDMERKKLLQLTNNNPKDVVFQFVAKLVNKDV